MNNARRTFALTAAGLIAAFGISAAAIAPAAAAETPVNASSISAEGPVTSFQGMVMITVHNDTASPITVTMQGKSASDKPVTKVLQPGETLKESGHTLMGSKDITGTITYGDGSKVSFWGYNPEIGYPSIGLGDGSNWDRYYENETISKSENGHSFDITRQGDEGGRKNFHIYAK